MYHVSGIESRILEVNSIYFFPLKRHGNQNLLEMSYSYISLIYRGFVVLFVVFGSKAAF